MLPRRDFLKTTSLASLGLAASPWTWAAEGSKPALPMPRGKAEHCIFVWLSGGASQVDTWDQKQKLGDGKKVPGSAYKGIDTAIKDVQICEHLPNMAKLLDRCALIRTVNHKAVDEHAAAVNIMHTGRPTSGTIVYPSIGSIVAQQKGANGEGVPAYIVMGYPNVTRGPGFLGAKHGYIYLTETEAGPAGLKRPDFINEYRAARRQQLLTTLREEFQEQHKTDKSIENYTAASETGFSLAGPKFMNVFDLKSEASSLRDKYGSEFGQRLLLSRRLVESGVRFIEVSSNLNFVNGTGWDTHNEGQQNQHLLIQELDQGLSTLITDLEQRKLLDKTLIVVATEFGRPPEFDAKGGRGHQSGAFSCVLAGGSLQTGRAIGVTDEIGKKIVSQPVSVPDLFATIHCALGINPHEELYDGERPVPITDQGQPIRELFS
jgi:hypothetical protein